jgi:hypothetical protein
MSASNPPSTVDTTLPMAWLRRGHVELKVTTLIGIFPGTSESQKRSDRLYRVGSMTTARAVFK